MTATELSRNLGSQLCQALRIDPYGVTLVQIKCSATAPIIVSVDRYVSEEDMESIIIELYEMHPRSDMHQTAKVTRPV